MTLYFIVLAVLLALVFAVSWAEAATKVAQETKPRETKSRPEPAIPKHISYKDVQSGKVHIDWKKVRAP